jgi:hypothetical protein
MPWWDPWREQRGWSRAHRDVPLSHFRGIVERDLFWQNPKKRRWAKRRLWWREHLRHRRASVLALSARDLLEPPQGLDVTVEI